MSGAIQIPDYHYVAYIDESGDQGLRTVKPIDANGSSEWLVVSAVVVRAENEFRVPAWVDAIKAELRSQQLQILHFRKLKPAWRKETVCRHMASLPVRCFVICSNKKNMKGYENPFAAKIPSQNWFYCWLTRVLLERVTHFVAADSRKRYDAVKRVKLIYSKAGGLSYGQMAAYYEWIRERRRGGHQKLNWGDLEYDTIHSHLLEVREQYTEPGLALADATAAAFYKACDKQDTGSIDTTFAKCLSDRMGHVPDMPSGLVSGYGVKLLPGWKKAELDSDQETIFRHFGYPKQWWDNRWAADPFAPTVF